MANQDNTTSLYQKIDIKNDNRQVIEQFDNTSILDTTLMILASEIICLIDSISQQVFTNPNNIMVDDKIAANILEFIEKFRKFLSNHNEEFSTANTDYIKAIISSIWSIHKHESLENSRIENETFRRYMIGTIISVSTDLLRENRDSFNNMNHKTIIIHILRLIIMDSHNKHTSWVEKYLNCVEASVDDPFKDMYKYLIDCDVLLEFDSIASSTLKLILRNILDAFITSELESNDVNFVANIDGLLKNIRVNNIDNIFNNDIPFDKSLLTDECEHIFDALETIAKVTVLGCTNTVAMILQRTNYNEHLLRNLMTIARRYKNNDCFEYLNYLLLKEINNSADINHQSKNNNLEHKIDVANNSASDDDEPEFYFDLFLLCVTLRIQCNNDEFFPKICAIL